MLYTLADSIKAHWIFGRTKVTEMICLSDHQTIAANCAIPKATSIESAIYSNGRLTHQ